MADQPPTGSAVEVSARSRSSLTKDLVFPEDLDNIALLHKGSDWKFYLTSLLRQHIIKNHLEKDLAFTARDPIQAYPFMIELTKVFNPISMLSLFKEMMVFYLEKVANQTLNFEESWYLGILRSYHEAIEWEQTDWYWHYALRNVIFIPTSGAQKLIAQLPGGADDWTYISGTQHTGCPEQYLIDRFPDCLSRVGDSYLVLSHDLTHKKIPVVSASGAWSVVYHKQSPVRYAIQDNDQFFLSLYPRVEGASFAFSMALDILQSNFTRADWKHNKWATKHYWKLWHADNRGLLRLNQPISSPVSSAGSEDDPNATSSVEPQPFSDLRLSIKLKAADVAFDYCSDYDLALVVTDMQSLVHNQNLPRKQRAIDFIVLDHLKGKIDLFNCVQAAATNTVDQ